MATAAATATATAARMPAAWRQLGTNDNRLWISLEEAPFVEELRAKLTRENLCIAGDPTSTADCQVDALWGSLRAAGVRVAGVQSAADVRRRVVEWLNEHLDEEVEVHHVGALTCRDVLRVIDPELSAEAFKERFQHSVRSRPQQVVWGNAATLVAASAALKVGIRVVSAKVPEPVTIDATTGDGCSTITIGHAHDAYFYPVRQQRSESAAGEQEEQEAGEQEQHDDGDGDGDGDGEGGGGGDGAHGGGKAAARATGGKRGRGGGGGRQRQQDGERGDGVTSKRRRGEPRCSKCDQLGHRSGEKKCPQYEKAPRRCSDCNEEGHTRGHKECKAYGMTAEQREALRQKVKKQRKSESARNKRTASDALGLSASAGRPGKRRPRPPQLTDEERKRVKEADKACWGVMREQMEANWNYELHEHSALIEWYYEMEMGGGGET